MQSAIQQQADARADAATNKAQAVGALGAANRETMDLNRRLEEAERQYANLAAQLAAKSGLGAFNGAKLATWPVNGPITSGFGSRWGGFHNGLDIAAPKFTPLRAASSGQVVTVGDRKSTRLNSSHSQISYAVFCLKKKNYSPCR